MFQSHNSTTRLSVRRWKLRNQTSFDSRAEALIKPDGDNIQYLHENCIPTSYHREKEKKRKYFPDFSFDSSQRTFANSSQKVSRNLNLWTFPESVLGNSSTITTYRGILKCDKRPRQYSTMSSCVRVAAPSLNLRKAPTSSPIRSSGIPTTNGNWIYSSISELEFFSSCPYR